MNVGGVLHVFAVHCPRDICFFLKLNLDIRCPQTNDTVRFSDLMDITEKFQRIVQLQQIIRPLDERDLEDTVIEPEIRDIQHTADRCEIRTWSDPDRNLAQDNQIVEY